MQTKDKHEFSFAPKTESVCVCVKEEGGRGKEEELLFAAEDAP